MKKTACLLVIILALAILPGGRSFHAAGETETAERLTAAVTMPEGRQEEAFLLTVFSLIVCAAAVLQLPPICIKLLPLAAIAA